ncbi:putative holin-like toxin [Brevibacillus sp. B_LB10_24]
MTVYEGLSLMVTFGALVLAMVSFPNKRK